MIVFKFRLSKSVPLWFVHAFPLLPAVRKEGVEGGVGVCNAMEEGFLYRLTALPNFVLNCYQLGEMLRRSSSCFLFNLDLNSDVVKNQFCKKRNGRRHFLALF